MNIIEKFKGMIAEGMKNFIPQVGAELDRQMKQGSMEFTSGLLRGDACVLHGPGLYSEEIGKTQHNEPAMNHEIQQEHGRHM